MDVSSFLGGNYLTHVDLPQPNQVWTIQQANQQLVGTDPKICISFAEFPAKPLGLNKTNLRRLAELYSTQGDSWIGKQLRVYRATTDYSGKRMQCIRVCGPGQATPEAVVDAQGNVLPPEVPAAPVPQPVATPQQQQPVAASQPAPWEADQAALQQNSPPSA